MHNLPELKINQMIIELLLIYEENKSELYQQIVGPRLSGDFSHLPGS